MLTPISTANVGLPERSGVSSTEAEKGKANSFGDLLAGLDTQTPPPPPEKTAKETSSKAEKEKPEREKECPVRTSVHSMLSDFLAGNPMPAMPMASTDSQTSAKQSSATPIPIESNPASSPLSETISLRALDLAAFDVRAIHVQVESLMPAGQQASLSGGVDGRILAELQGGLQQVLPATVTVGPLEQSLIDAAAQNAVQGSALTAVAAARVSADAQSADILPEARPTDTAAHILTAIPPIPDSSNHGPSQQSTGGEHEKPAADQSAKIETVNAAVPSNAPVQFESQLATGEHAVVAHTPELPPEAAMQTAHRVSIDIGENESKVTVTLHERGGDVSMKIHSANQPLSSQLQSSVGSLVEALHREHVSLSNMDFSSGGSQSHTPQDSQDAPQSRPRRIKVADVSIPMADEGFPTGDTGININA